jgi:hypothetical protein
MQYKNGVLEGVMHCKISFVVHQSLLMHYRCHDLFYNAVEC